ncbi:citrate lyase subunit beta-like protein, mitochondrial [Limulus polyphemus]|uniref:Citrate lyase subunit beta-like protein, mitochondrial n=1 Tax=Limulus polyphemus TaxID=6850 RepID=A0ABM1BSI4_LIMPO|nr:citrate lyase subunit beta-like protein, mitochondrial [Limulus polyphemus]XP_013787813.1 citrate lyase subunit beta-like protein, mitochondrial [Limulus polyphemus]
MAGLHHQLTMLWQTGAKRCSFSFFTRFLWSSCSRNNQVTEKRGIFGKKYIPRRAVLYVPGDDERKLKKVPTLNVDCAVLDCEDGVALSKKEEARKTIRHMLDQVEFGRTECVVRMNSVDSGLASDDMKEVFKAGRLPPTIMFPKVESVDHVEWISEELFKHLRTRTLVDKINLIIYIESAKSLLDLRTICQRAVDLSEKGLFILDGVVFGSDDFCADIGATRTLQAKEVLLARQNIVLVAKSLKIQAVDLVYIDYKDLKGLKEQSLEGAQMGFTGKQVIHPSQIPIVQEAFAPSTDKIEWAKELIKEFKEHQMSGMGAFEFRGAMIDKPLLLQAQNIVQLAEVLEL